ncbi:hypothetical protein S83_042975, partial [Arachis hypogaea]
IMKLSWLLSTREAIVHYYLFEHYQDDLAVVLLNLIQVSRNFKKPLIVNTVSGEKTGAITCFERATCAIIFPMSNPSACQLCTRRDVEDPEFRSIQALAEVGIVPSKLYSKDNYGSGRSNIKDDINFCSD